jgi:hypothetical protein
MSIDAEGRDLEVLASNDWGLYRPTLLIVEMNQDRNNILQFLQSVEYGLLINNHVNGLFVDMASKQPIVRHLLSRPLIG